MGSENSVLQIDEHGWNLGAIFWGLSGAGGEGCEELKINIENMGTPKEALLILGFYGLDVKLQLILGNPSFPSSECC